MAAPLDTVTGRTAAGGLRSNAIVLAAASGVEYGIQLAIPIVLVRCLDATSFGQYRLLWLLASTALAIAPAFMPQSLFYFLPRVGTDMRRIYIGNVLLYLLAAAVAASVAFSGWSPLLPQVAKQLFFDTHGLSSLFVAAWVAASVLETLPTANGHARWQAKATVALALLRAALLVGAALLTAHIIWIAIAMIVVACVRLGTVALYIAQQGGKTRIGWQPAVLRTQLAYALPFALGNALFLLRAQSGEWVAASMFPPALYAAFSIAAVVVPIATLIRQPVYNAMMPYLNLAYTRGDKTEVARLIAKSNGATALVLIPSAGALVVMAPQLVDMVYTRSYSAAAPVMQLYLCTMMMNAFAVGHILPALDKRRFAMLNNAGCLALSIILSILGAMYWGLPGAAFGYVLTFAISELASLVVVAHELGTSMHRLLVWRALVPTAFATMAGIAGALTVSLSFDGNAYQLLLLESAVYLTLFATCFFLLGGSKHLGLLMRSKG